MILCEQYNKIQMVPNKDTESWTTCHELDVDGTGAGPFC